MPTSLGLYIENNLIKYAKVTKNNEAVKVESFGVKFYDNIQTTIRQIIEETYSFKTPITINTSDEIYDEIEVFKLLSKKDIDNVIKTEFENICYEKDINKNAYEQRYILTNLNNSDDKIKSINISVPKTSIEQRKNQFSDYKISNILPLSISINSLIKSEKKETVLIVNIEKNTTITKITNGNISNIYTVNAGGQEILEKIARKENSFAKAYDVCKSSTIYAETDKDLQYEENEYLEDIMPTLFQIASEIRKITNQSVENIEKLYITGTMAVINNIDIYFQNFLENINCEILKPSFINTYSKINIKDYIEVNSAISLAIQGMEKDNKSINFNNESSAKKIFELLNSNVSDLKVYNVNKAIDNVAKKLGGQTNIIIITCSMLIISYFMGTVIINKQLEDKIAKANKSISSTNERISKMQEYKEKFNSKTSTYKLLISEIENNNNANSQDKRYKYTIPNLLNNIMAVIPKNVQLTSIQNTAGTHIVIKANSKKYEQLAYFKTKLKTEGILNNVISDTGTASKGVITVTIEGELP